MSCRRPAPPSPTASGIPTGSTTPGSPLNPLQILWLTMVIDIPIAIALGFDQATSGLMERPPRPVEAPVLSRANWVRLCIQGAVMTVGALVAYQIGHHQTGAVVGSTMLLTTFSAFHLAAAFLCRDQVDTIFDRDAIPGAVKLRRYGVAALAAVAVTTIGVLERIFGTTSLTFAQWCTCVAIARWLVVAEEAIKWLLRRRAYANSSQDSHPAGRVASALG